MAGKPDFQPGLPVDIIGAAGRIMDKLHELYVDHGVYSPVKLIFTAHDDAMQSHDLHFTFDPERGDGEYVLVHHE